MSAESGTRPLSGVVRRAPRKQVLMAASKAIEGPWCPISYVKQIEVQGGLENDMVRIEVRDSTRVSTPDPYYIKGPRMKQVNIPRGSIRVVRVKGALPITVYAHCGE